jgi:histidinol-phosphatase (PHP family)
MIQNPAPADYHMHTPLCHHAEGWPVEYAAVAIERGLDEIGFSDHNPMAAQFDDWRMSIDDLPRYLEEVQAARCEFANRLTIRLGLECDFLEGREAWIEELSNKAGWDYLIGSVHYINEEWAIDDPDPKWNSQWLGKIGEVWDIYWEKYRRCAASGLFDFLAHPDLVKKFGHRPEGDLRRFYEPTIKVIAEAGVAIEISTAGLRKPCAELYPADGFLSLAAEAGVPIVISSDAHRPDEVGLEFETAIAAARRAGFSETCRFEKRRRSSVAL